MIYVMGPRDSNPRPSGCYVNTTSRGGLWRGLSPFNIGPCPLYDGRVSCNMENGWQYAKVYDHYAVLDFANKTFIPHERYWNWAEAGWANQIAVRYPMGKGARPRGSWWNGRALGYIEARKEIYIPLYRDAVRQTPAWRELRAMHLAGTDLVLWDYDGRVTNESLREVMGNPLRKMGHAFVLKMMLLHGEDFDWRTL